MPKVSETYLTARSNEIVDAAAACFLRKGFHQSTMQDICAEAQLSPGAIYRYFASKDEIMRAVIERNTERWTEVVEHSKQLSPEPGAVLWAIGQYFFQRFHEPDFEQRVGMEIECRPEILRDPELRGALRTQMQTVRSLIAGLVRAQYGDADIDAESMVNLFMAIYTGLEQNKMVDPEGVDTDAVLATLDSIFGFAEQSLGRGEGTVLRHDRTEEEA